MADLLSPPDGWESRSMEFHVSRRARERYEFDESLFSINGNVIFANFHAARLFAEKMNRKRDLVANPEQAVRAGEINTMGLIDEILHYIFDQYRRQKHPNVMSEALDWLGQRLGQDAVEKTLRRFVEEFPPLAVYRRQIDPVAYLASATAGVSNREIVLEEMLMLWLANMNPAVGPFTELFDDTVLERDTSYLQIIFNLHQFFDRQPRWGSGGENANVIDMLRAPAISVPYSLSGQLEFIREKWSAMLGNYHYRMLSSLDLLKEEEKAFWGGGPGGHGGGPGPAFVIELAGQQVEPERYSPDLDWMPNLVMLAKSTYVWLDQLSKQYQRSITRLDQVPDEELDTLGRWGFTGLWLIGLWERSRASQTIKRQMGNPEAVASAYSLFDYQIAEDLGGEEAYETFRKRAAKRGIRLASDMVPNHMGMDSKWVIEHPDWFISLDYSPFPAYSFSGPDLSWDGRVGIQLEDHYYSRSDAAVVFKRSDHWTGSERYIYHGNDGTSMPWNDTAQLNLLNPEVREAVIQTILSVARRFNIIRFDAAMTLAKRHYQRLWFPEPGTGGAIPSRADYGLTKAAFDAAMPEEFWREVVDRVAQEVPDTLLLAEAFWLMEGYFVRTLGMHRVYNSAFMNMLKDEENSKYRLSIKNVLEFDPEILKRFVNFINNPDEETAVAQFGKDDKYFGVCTMMVTMPGLPMFGHGQVEGYTEKYGMEYRRAYKNEQADWGLVQRHEREIFPLMHRRHIFADAEDFLLYDYFAPEGYVNENVFAYSNRAGEERGLVVFNNKFEDAHGWIRTSVAYSVKTGQGEERALVQKSLGDGLGLCNEPACFCIFRDQVSGLEYIRNSQELYEKGLYVELGAYKYQVFLDFREVRDDAAHHYARLASFLDGRAVASIDDALQEMYLQPIQQPFKDLVNKGMFQRLMDARTLKSADNGNRSDEALLAEVEEKVAGLLRVVKELSQGPGENPAVVAGDGTIGAATPDATSAPMPDVAALAKEARRELEIILQLPDLAERIPAPAGKSVGGATPAAGYHSALQYLQGNLTGDPGVWGALFGWWAVHALARVTGQPQVAWQSRGWIDEWRLGRIIAGTLQEMGVSEAAAAQSVTLIKVLTSHQRWFVAAGGKAQRTRRIAQSLFADSDVQRLLQVNRYKDVLWFNKEAFEQLQWWLLLVAVFSAESAGQTPEEATAQIGEYYQIIHKMQQAERKSGYQVERLLVAL